MENRKQLKVESKYAESKYAESKYGKKRVHAVTGIKWDLGMLLLDGVVAIRIYLGCSSLICDGG